MKMNFKKIPRKEWPEEGERETRIAVWMSEDYFVQIFNDKSGYTRLSINSTWYQLNDCYGATWKDQLTWDELQEIKNQLGYRDHWLCELYPPRADVVNVANIRHLFVLPEKPEFAF